MNTRTIVLAAVVLVVGGLAATGAVAGGTADGSPDERSAVESVVADRAASVAQSSCGFPVTRTDVTGTEVTVEERPKRIVALTPNDAQVLWEIGAQDRVVGMPVNQYTSYLDDRPEDGDVSGQGTVEKVVGFRPDLVVASNSTRVDIDALRDRGLTVYHFGTVRSLDEIARNMETVGRLVGSCDRAASEAQEFRLAVERAQTAHEGASDRPRVLHYMGEYTTGSDTHIHDVITSAGGVNVADEAGVEGYKRLSDEIVVNQTVEWITYSDTRSPPDEPPFADTTAVRDGQTVALNADYLSQPGPRVAIPLTKLAKTWYPEGMAEANRTVNMSDVSTPNRTAADTTSANGPGFGAAVAVLAVIAAALVAIRRD